MERVIALAKRLGEAIGETERFKKLCDAEKAATENAEAREALAKLEACQQEVGEKERQGTPVEPEEKHRLADLQAAVHANPVLQALARAQADYMELMNKVNQTIRSELRVE